MRDPFSWALPLYRLFGIHVKVHLFFFLITLPLFLRTLSETKGFVHWFDLFMLTVGMVFLIVLLHEYGHCFAARAVGGSSDQILIWPLGGLAYVEVPNNPRAHFWTTLWGPLVNAILCAGCAVIMLVGGYSPLRAFNPLGSALATPTYRLSDERLYTSEYASAYYKPGTSELTAPETPGAERALAPKWLPWVWRFCWLNWWLFLFNVLIPAYPMDGGRLLHSILWARKDYRSATITCCYVGYAAGAVLFMISIFANEALLLGLAFFIILNCYRTLQMEMEGDSGAFGYDFSQGYTSLEKDEAMPLVRRPGLIRRWLQARKIRKIREEHDQRAADEARMDELLDKIAKVGKQSLSDEERRFMERVSAQYRNRSS